MASARTDLGLPWRLPDVESSFRHAHFPVVSEFAEGHVLVNVLAELDSISTVACKGHEFVLVKQFNLVLVGLDDGLLPSAS